MYTVKNQNLSAEMHLFNTATMLALLWAAGHKALYLSITITLLPPRGH